MAERAEVEPAPAFTITNAMRKVWRATHQHEVLKDGGVTYRRPPCPRLETLASHRIAGYLRKGSG